MPILRRELIAAAAFDSGARDIDVDALHQGWLRPVKRQGGEIATRTPVSAIHRETAGWLIEAEHRRIRAGVVVNAAGATSYDPAIGEGENRQLISAISFVARKTRPFAAGPPGKLCASTTCETGSKQKNGALRLGE